MDLWMIFFASLGMGFSGAIMPGPLLTVTINESLRRGGWVGPRIVSGHAILELGLVVLVFFGLGQFITLPWIKGSIGLIGGLFLLWMAIGIIKEALSDGLALNLAGQGERESLNPIVAGITVSASNPYWSMWWATAGSGSLMLAAAQGPAGAASFYSGHILADLLWYSLVSFAVAKGKKLFTPRIYRGVLLICGVFLLGLSGYFMLSGFRFWLEIH